MEGDSKLNEIKSYCGSVGVLIDRTLPSDGPIATVWLIDEDKVATCGHVVLPYAEHLQALRVVFPSAGQERGVSRAYFHPKFQRRTATHAMQEFGGELSMLALQKHNAVVLSLTDTLPDLSNDRVIEVNRKLTLPAPKREQLMGGSLSEIDLSLVIQTVNNARKAGVLIIADERNRPIARIACDDGRMVYAQFESLVNENALYQIFSMHLEGSFYLLASEDVQWQPTLRIMRPSEALLIESHRRMDELPKLIELLGGAHGLWKKRDDNLRQDVLPQDVQEVVNRVWPLLDGNTPASQLWRLSALDDYMVYQTLVELKRTGHLMEVQPEPVSRNEKMRPIPVASQLPLAPMDVLTSLTVDDVTARSFTRTGSLLGTLRAQDPWHLVHNLPLVPEACGSPIFKEGLVIGMHCGTLPPDARAMESGGLQQMLWVDSVVQCLSEGGEAALAKKLTQTGINLAPPRPPEAAKADPGCREVARVDCPKCGSVSLESARFCKTCGQRLIRDVSTTAPRAKKKKPVSPMPILAAVGLLGVMAAGVIAAAKALPGPVILPDEYVTAPESPWLHLVIKKATTDGSGMFKEVPRNANMNEGDVVYLKVTLNEPSYVYVFALPSSANHASLVYPFDPESDKLRLGSDFFTCPRNTEEYSQDENKEVEAYTVGSPAGTDTFLAVASHTPGFLLKDPKLVEPVFRRAKMFLDQHENLSSVEVDATALGDNVFANQSLGISTPGVTQRKSVFITRLKLIHR